MSLGESSRNSSSPSKSSDHDAPSAATTPTRAAHVATHKATATSADAPADAARRIAPRRARTLIAGTHRAFVSCDVRARICRDEEETRFERVLAKQSLANNRVGTARGARRFSLNFFSCSTNERSGFSPDSTIRDILIDLAQLSARSVSDMPAPHRPAPLHVVADATHESRGRGLAVSTGSPEGRAPSRAAFPRRTSDASRALRVGTVVVVARRRVRIPTIRRDGHRGVAVDGARRGGARRDGARVSRIARARRLFGRRVHALREPGELTEPRTRSPTRPAPPARPRARVSAGPDLGRVHRRAHHRRGHGRGVRRDRYRQRHRRSERGVVAGEVRVLREGVRVALSRGGVLPHVRPPGQGRRLVAVRGGPLHLGGPRPAHRQPAAHGVRRAR